MNRPEPTAMGLGLRAALLALAAAGLHGCASQPARDTELVDEKVLLASGERAERRGDPDSALMEYARAVAAYPKSAEPHFRAARVHATLGNDAIARDGYLRALQLEPEHLGALEGLGLFLLDQGRSDDARQLLQRVVDRDAQRWRALNGLGILADLEGRHEDAQGLFAQALGLQPGRAELVNNLGYSYYLQGNLEAAQALFERAVATAPTAHQPWSNLGLVYALQRRYEDSVEAFEQISEPGQARYSAAYVCMLEGRGADAEQLLRGAIRESAAYYPAAEQALRRLRERRAAAR